ncbi:MAG: nucleotidyl transferase AbiEii/AbiGii toxin family protein [bacterium]|nr:nucleotidyl transferase AbiEii/AbiGii toxin family protein [bacterium]
MSENISKIHLEILSKQQQEVLLKLQPVLKDFVLGGGTALALQIKHRQSFDFDFFTLKPIDKNLLEKISQLGFSSTAPIFDSVDELTLIIDNEIKITFLSYPFSKIFNLVFLDQNIQTFSLSGLAAQKAYTIGRGGVWRDYYDIFTLLRHKFFTLKEIIGLTQKNYGDIFNPKLFLSQLVYFEDIQDYSIEPINNSLNPIASNEVKAFLEEEVEKYLESIK